MEELVKYLDSELYIETNNFTRGNVKNKAHMHGDVFESNEFSSV